MNGLFEAAQEVCAFMEAQNWKFCIIGGLAVQHWGEPRTTLDVDITLLTDWGEEARFIDPLLNRFASRVTDPSGFALRNRVLLLRSSKGTDIDIALGALPFEAEMIRRARHIEFAPGIVLPCCTAEDLFIMKCFAGRDRDWVDAQGIAARQPGLDRTYILSRLEELGELRDRREPVERARALLEPSP